MLNFLFLVLEGLSIPLEELEEEVPGDRELWESHFSSSVAKNGWVDNIGITKKKLDYLKILSLYMTRSI